MSILIRIKRFILHRKYFIDNYKLKVKYFHEYMTSWEYFYFEHISLSIIHACSRYHGEALNCGKTINTYTYHTMATPYYI